ncbi:hypothetical protein GCM10023092_27070 [Rurimicrobium arvi]|uniref:Secretion system C-terminal sorting domain-containing protein n=2 Tax=Rurimicrobium arvi TaxID=2049916 RepID=A0ABP8N0W2_9BACT
MLTLNIVPTLAQDFYKMPARSRPDLFTFYSSNNVNRPPGSDIAGKSVIHIAGVDPTLPMESFGSTAFIIRSFRNDDRFCVCMTGHQAEIFNGGQSPTVPGYVSFNNNIHMDYLGEDDYANGTGYVRINNYSSAYLSHGELVEYFNDLPVGRDAALFLVDKSWFPSENFAALGYDFTPINEQSGGNHYVLGHGWDHPLRLSDYGVFQGGNQNSVDIFTSLPFAFGSSSSGSPLLTRTSGTTVNPLVKGILSMGLTPTFVNEYAVDGIQRSYAYSSGGVFTRISLLESAIRKHCWNKQDSTAISGSGIYKQTVMVSNLKPQLSINQTVSAATDISGSSAAFTKTAVDGKNITQFIANNCVMGGFILPVIYPGTTATPWRVVVSANRVDVNAGFSYTASGTSELDLTTIETYTRSATSRLADAADTASNTSVAGSGAAPGFKLYPNPSPDGVFFLELPATEKDIVYTGSIMSVDGKLVQQLDHMQGGAKASFNLSQQPRGMYLLTVHNAEGRLVFTTKITWQ